MSNNLWSFEKLLHIEASPNERSDYEDAYHQTSYTRLRHMEITSPYEMITQLPELSEGS
ncbi:MAG: hypothetical protein M9933_15875 [Chitinophagaceae bacterium]|nr:hypothetical protein [Chitinophagaceae bacterium]